MTAVVGFSNKKEIWIGADCAGTAGYCIERRKDGKVFINGGFIMGFTSSFRMGQLLRYSFTPPAKKEGQDLLSYMVTDFVDSVRGCFKSGGYAQVTNCEEQGGTFLVGHEGRLFKIESDFQVSESIEDFAAIGCGQDIALGSMFSTKGKEPEERIRMALSAAEEYNSAVRGPFNVLKLGG